MNSNTGTLESALGNLTSAVTDNSGVILTAVGAIVAACALLWLARLGLRAMKSTANTAAGR